MSIEDFSMKLKTLSKEFFQGHLELDEYRAQRKVILDEIDEKFNGR